MNHTLWFVLEFQETLYTERWLVAKGLSHSQFSNLCDTSAPASGILMGLPHSAPSATLSGGLWAEGVLEPSSWILSVLTHALLLGDRPVRLYVRMRLCLHVRVCMRVCACTCAPVLAGTCACTHP